MQDCLSFLMAWVQGVFAWLASLNIFTGINVLGIIVAFYVLYILEDYFVPKG